MGFLVDSQHLATVKRAVMKEAESHFSPEFLNRIDDIIVFSPLTQEEVEEIARRYLAGVHRSLVPYGKSLQFSESALKILAESGFSLKYGARFLKRRIDEQVKIPITLHWQEGSRFTIDAREGQAAVTWDP
jgi:ATP-dependent Clp protease ATP-binding subunit ClpA